MIIWNPRIFMAIYLFSQILKFTKYRIKLIEKVSRRHLINSSDVTVIKGFTGFTVEFLLKRQRWFKVSILLVFLSPTWEIYDEEMCQSLSAKSINLSWTKRRHLLLYCSGWRGRNWSSKPTNSAYYSRQGSTALQ